MSENKHLVIPDTQVRPGVSLDHFTWIGGFIRAKRPNVIVHLGDHWDMSSLSSYDRGKRSSENRRFGDDIDSGNRALEMLSKPWRGLRSYSPRLVMLRGNHEQRIERATEDSAWLHGTLSYDLFNDRKLGWDPVPFLHPICIDGITYCHFFPRGPTGKVMQTVRGAPSAKEQVRRHGGSCTAGHQQGLDTAIVPVGNGAFRGVIAGSCYLHDEGYLSPQGQNHWRGVLLKHRVKNGNYSLCEVDLDYLEERYG